MKSFRFTDEELEWLQSEVRGALEHSRQIAKPGPREDPEIMRDTLPYRQHELRLLQRLHKKLSGHGRAS